MLAPKMIAKDIEDSCRAAMRMCVPMVVSCGDDRFNNVQNSRVLSRAVAGYGCAWRAGLLQLRCGRYCVLSAAAADTQELTTWALPLPTRVCMRWDLP